MSEQTQFDLRIVGGEGGANTASELGADGNVLQVGIRRRKTSRGRSGLAEGGMQTSGGAIDERRKRVDVCGLQFRELAVVENFSGNRMLFRQRFENVDGS